MRASLKEQPESDAVPDENQKTIRFNQQISCFHAIDGPHLTDAHQNDEHLGHHDMGIRNGVEERPAGAPPFV